MPKPALYSYLLLTLLVWGLFAFDAGFWQDDSGSLARAVRAANQGVTAFFVQGATPTRRIQSVVYGTAASLPDPLLFLHVLAGAVWLGQGLLADRLAVRLFAPRAWIGYVGGGLTLCATGDMLTGSLVGLGYQLSTLAFGGALLLLLRWCDGGRPWSLGVSAALVAVALWTSDAPLSALAIMPLLLWGLGVPARRAAWGGLVWLLAVLPYLVVFTRQWFDPAGYARAAMLSLAPAHWASAAWRLFVYNFTPWRWVSHPPVFTDANPAPLLPATLYWGASMLGAAVFATVLWRLAERERAVGGAGPPKSVPPTSRPVAVMAALALMTLGLNVAFANVHVSTSFYRTHLVSRFWSSLLLAGAIAWLLRQAGRWRPLVVALPAAVVALGIWGGLERQDFFLASTRAQRVELQSIREAAPGLVPGSLLVLHAPADRGFRATEAEYLAKGWAILLYDDPSMFERTLVWCPERNAGCRFDSDGLRCWGEGQQACFAAGDCAGARVPYERAVVLTYEPASGRYRLVRRLEAIAPAALPPAAAEYRPELMLRPTAASARTLSLIAPRPFLSRWVPADPGARR